MAKKSIVFVSFDEEYISVIEYKFTCLVEKSASVEFISDKNSFKRLMNIPRKIDILIVPEGTMISHPDAYSKTKIFYLTDNKEDNEQKGYIYKYYSVKSIVEKLGIDLVMDGEGAKGTRVIGVYSVAGGTGKTITSLVLSYKLRKKGKRVLYISTVPQQDFSYYIDSDSSLSSSFSYQCSINMKNALKTIDGEIVNGDFEFLPKFKNLPVSYQISFDTYMQIVTYMKMKNVYDYIIVEMSSDIQQSKLKFMSECDKVIFVTTQDEVAVRQMETLIDSMSDNSAEVLIVCNRAVKMREDYLKSSFLSKHFEVVERIDEYGKPLTYDTVKDSVLFKNLISVFE